ncbi:MAG: fumarylacetoacetate hydrolase family protein [Acidovorax sp.]
MTLSNIDKAAQALVQARRSGEPVPAAGLADAIASVDDAYAVQQRVADALGWCSGTEAARHWKSGGPSRTAPLTHAPLPPGGVWASPARAGNWPFRVRGIEAEIALRLGSEVDAALAATLDASSAQALVAAMAVSIEVVDSRWSEGLRARPLAMLADAQVHGALVLGEWRPFAPRDWTAQTCRVQVGAQAPVERCGDYALGDPAWLLPAWLRHATRDGRRVATGTVVTTGTWAGILWAAAGDLVTVEFPGIGNASVQL